MKAAVKGAPTGSANAEKQLNSFIDKFDPKNQALIRAVRKALRKRLPTANELGYDNYNFFALGYCATERSPVSSLRGAWPGGKQKVEAKAHSENDPGTPEPRLSSPTREFSTGKPSMSAGIFDPGESWVDFVGSIAGSEEHRLPWDSESTKSEGRVLPRRKRLRT